MHGNLVGCSLFLADEMQRGCGTHPRSQDQADIVLRLDLEAPGCQFEIFLPDPLPVVICW